MTLSKMKTEHFEIFNEKQLSAIKEILRRGAWGDCDMNFGKNETSNYAYGYFTNLKKGKEFSGLMSGIAKKIESTGTTAFKSCSNWWDNGAGDMLFFNMDLLECNRDELEAWAEG